MLKCYTNLEIKVVFFSSESLSSASGCIPAPTIAYVEKIRLKKEKEKEQGQSVQIS